MAIRKLPNGKYQVDWYVGTNRERRNFDSKNAAETFNRDRRLREIYGSVSNEISERKTIAEAAKWYHSTVSAGKERDSFEAEKHFFALLYECLRSNAVIARDAKKAQLQYIDEVELAHLTAIQTYLTTHPTHGICKSHEKMRVQSEVAKLNLATREERQSLVAERMSNFSIITPADSCLVKNRKGNLRTCRAVVLSPSRVNRLFNTFNDFFNRCDQNGWLKKNPSLYLKSMKERPKIKKVHDDKTVQSLIDGAYELAESSDGRAQHWNDVGNILWFLAKTGARPVGLKRLKWAHVDLSNRQMELRSLKGSGDEKVHIVPLTDELCEFLIERKESARKRLDAKNDSPVFRAARGAEFDSKAFARSVSILCEKLGVEDFSPYCLRHGFVTRARRIGITIQDAGDLAGHSKIETTRKIYDHSGAEDRRPAMKQIGAALNIRRKGFSVPQ